VAIWDNRVDASTTPSMTTGPSADHASHHGGGRAAGECGGRTEPARSAGRVQYYQVAYDRSRAAWRGGWPRPERSRGTVLRSVARLERGRRGRRLLGGWSPRRMVAPDQKLARSAPTSCARAGTSWSAARCSRLCGIAPACALGGLAIGYRSGCSWPPWPVCPGSGRISSIRPCRFSGFCRARAHTPRTSCGSASARGQGSR